MATRSKRERLIEAESGAGAPVSTGAMFGMLGVIVVLGLIAATITLGVLYGNAKAALPQNTTTVTNLLYPGVTRRVVLAPAFDNVVGFTAINFTLTTTIIETPSFYQVTSTFEGTLTTGTKKRGMSPTQGYFNITSFFPLTPAGTSAIGTSKTIEVDYTGQDPVFMFCNVTTSTELQCGVLGFTGLEGTIASPSTFSYVINR
jgi:hypothetical protein